MNTDEQYDFFSKYNMNTTGHYHTWVPAAHQHAWYDGNVQIDAERIMFQTKNLTRGLEDMARLLKMIVEKYDLHEVKKLVEYTEVAVWAKDGEYRAKDICEEKKKHLDEKLFEI
jgi:hypothetical protein